MILLSIILSICIFMTIWLVTEVGNTYINKIKRDLTILTLIVSLLWGIFFYLNHYILS
jgi:hypothetical protein